MKWYNDQRNAQVFIYLFTSVLHDSGFILAHLHRQVFNFVSFFMSPGYFFQRLGADTIPRRLEPLP
jgi:hypothetical protein